MLKKAGVKTLLVGGMCAYEPITKRRQLYGGCVGWAYDNLKKSKQFDKVEYVRGATHRITVPY